MINMKIVLVLFVVLACIQLFVPAKMIFDGEHILANGKEFKFRTAPVDPNDPFRGKYLTLQYKEDHYFSMGETWNTGEKVFVELFTDTDGYAAIQYITKSQPEESKDYVIAKVDYQDTGQDLVYIHYPFDRFFVEESKAAAAEMLYNKVQSDSSKVTYALVNVKGGAAVLKDIKINEKSILEQLPAEQ
jgi:uncharacterized membrane-anchored protein